MNKSAIVVGVATAPCALPCARPFPQPFRLRPTTNTCPPTTRRLPTSPAQRAPAVVAAAAPPSQQPSTSGRCLPANFSLTSPDNRWRVRLIDKANAAEVAAVVGLQAEGFHTPGPLPFLDGTFKRFFAAEVLSEMKKKLKYNPEDRFVCLVVEGGSGTDEGVVGIVEVSYIDEKEVLASLEPGTTGVAYIQSMATDLAVRRQGAAAALLAAAEAVAREWAEPLAVLHVYQDNAPAVALYKKSGFQMIYQDAPWLAKLAVRPRFLMCKRWEE